MSRHPRPFPVYPKRGLKHGGGARIKIAGKPYFLGKHNSPKSFAEYERLRLEHASRSLDKPKPAVVGMRISDLVASWYAADPRGKEHGEVKHTARACVPLDRLYGDTAAREFSALKLESLQLVMISCEWMTADERKKNGDWSRRYINAQIDRIRRVFRWAEVRGHVGPGTWQHLRTVPPIKQNDRRVRNNPPRKPVDWERQVVPTLDWLYPQVAAMVLVQFYGGMRPGEVVRMRRNEIDQNGPHGTWIYRPAEHKGSHRGQDLAKLLGPQGQAALSPWLLKTEPTDFVFPPVSDRWNRGHYTAAGYRRAICDACEVAGVERWFPYGLRHLAKQLATRAFGLDATRAYLGQLSLGATALYARAQDLEEAARVAAKIG